MYQTIIDQLGDPAASVRQIAAWSLGRLACKDAIKGLMRMVRGDPDELVRMAAAEALGRIGDPIAVTALVAALEDADPAVRRVVVVNLARLRSESAVPALRTALLLHENASLRPEISRVLEALTGVPHPYLSATQRKIERYKTELAQKPNDGHVHYNLSVAYFYEKQYALASVHCQIAKKLGAGVSWVEERIEDALATVESIVEPSEDRTEGDLVAASPADLDDARAGNIAASQTVDATGGGAPSAGAAAVPGGPDHGPARPGYPPRRSS